MCTLRCRLLEMSDASTSANQQQGHEGVQQQLQQKYDDALQRMCSPSAVKQRRLADAGSQQLCCPGCWSLIGIFKLLLLLSCCHAS
jgi:hypothetical protein